MIQNRHDCDVFEYYTTHCLYVVEPDPTEAEVNASFANTSYMSNVGDNSLLNTSTMSVAATEPILKLIGNANGNMYTSIAMSPDTSRLLVHRWCKPFSYLVRDVYAYE